jgi:hypothetical protein
MGYGNEYLCRALSDPMNIEDKLEKLPSGSDKHRNPVLIASSMILETREPKGCVLPSYPSTRACRSGLSLARPDTSKLFEDSLNNEIIAAGFFLCASSYFRHPATVTRSSMR